MRDHAVRGTESSARRSGAYAVTWVTAVATLVASGSILSGWLLDIEWLRSPIASQVSMKANTAAGFVVCAIVLLLAKGRQTNTQMLLRWSLEAGLLLLSIATLAQIIFGFELGVDQLIVAAPSDEILTGAPGQMAPTTAAGFGVFALALIVDHWRQQRFGILVSRVFATSLLFIGFTSLVGYVYEAPPLYFGTGGAFTAMALPTAVAFSIVALGAIWLHPDAGLPALFRDDSIIGSHTRALLIMVVGAPILVGGAVAAGYGRFYDGQFAIALTSIGSAFVAVTVAVVSIVVLRRAEGALYIKDRALAAATNGVVITDHRDTDEPIVFVNEAFSQITGYASDECFGRNCRFLNEGIANSRDVMDTLRRCAKEGKRGTVELLNRRKDGATFWNRLNLAPVENYEGTVTHLVGIVDDVTSERLQEDRLRTALEQAKSANDMRHTLIRLISHELRTPLNAALTWLRLMEVDDSAQTREKGLSVMVQSIDSQSRLIDDLVDVTRIASTGLRLEKNTTDVRNLIETTIEELRPLVENAHELHVNLAPSTCMATIDKVRVQQIVRNLVSNAVKYTSAGGRIAIGLDHDDKSFCLTVRDNGKGLAREDLNNIFEPFWRVDSALPGIGVGLSIVAALVESHGGTVDVRSDGVGQGSTFEVRLPLEAASSESAGQAGDVPASEQPATLKPTGSA